ncbi:Hint domain-containing protein [Tranquillimonas rosea]|uniref:Hint domain-containing protein n=1 Tax=Tranquillimonas rosea TaxID=641238 RepID=UPI003BADA0F3
MFYDLRGDTIGTYDEAHVEGHRASELRLRLSGVRAMGRADERFQLQQVAPPSVEAAPSRLYFALHGPGGDLIAADLIARAEAMRGLAGGDNHVVFETGGSGARILLDLDGLRRHPQTRFYGKQQRTTPARRGGRADIPSVCFTEGTPMLSGVGRRNVEDLEIGDGVWTLDRGIRPLRWKTEMSVRFDDSNAHLRPIRFDSHALATGYPDKPVWLAPGHRVLVSGWRADLFFGVSEVLVPAAALTQWKGVARDDEIAEVRYHCLLLDTHEVVSAGGLMCETLFPREALDATSSARAQAAIRKAFPQLKMLNGRLCGPAARTVATAEGQLSHTGGALS